MRRIYVFSWLMLLLCLSQNTQSQQTNTVVNNLLDKERSKIKIDLGEGNYLLFSKKTFTLYADLQKAKNVQEHLQQVQKYLNVLKDSLDKYKSYEIHYRISDENTKPTFSIKSLEPYREYYEIEQQKVEKSKATQDIIHIVEDSLAYDLYLFVNQLSDIEKISQQNINEYISLIVKDIDENLKKRWYKNNLLDLVYMVENNTIKRSQKNFPPIAYISLGPILGLNVIRDRFVPEASLYLQTTLRDTWYIGASFTAHYLFDRDADNNYQTLGNYFAGFRVGFNPVNKYRDKEQYYWGLGLAYLVRREGEFYQPETFKFSIDLKTPKNNFILSPQLYFGQGDAFIGFQLGRIF